MTVWVNKSSNIAICHLLTSPDRIIQAVNTILRRDNHLSGWLSKFNPFYFAVIPLAPNFYKNLTTTFLYKPAITINVKKKLTMKTNDSATVKTAQRLDISGSVTHGGDYEDGCLPGCSAV
jgi:hypothetical protein